MRKKKKTSRNTLLAAVFLSLIAGIILLSGVLKIFLIVKNSKFGQEGGFSIFVTNKKQNKIITFRKDRNTISVLSIKGKTGDIYKFVEVPIDGILQEEKIGIEDSPSEIVSEIALKTLKAKGDINILDAARMLIMVKFISPGDIIEKEIDVNYSEAQRDSILTSIFSDPIIEEEEVEIEVINDTEKQGVGNRLARLISNMGGSVVLVSTGDGTSDSAIYSDSDSYTVKRLSQVLNFPIVKGKMSKIAEVTVLVGKNFDRLSKY